MENAIKLKCRSCNMEKLVSDLRKHPSKDAWICISCFNKLQKSS